MRSGEPGLGPVSSMADRAAEAVAAALERIDVDGEAGVFIEVVDRSRALAAAAVVDAAVAAGEALPLAGRTLAVKGNIDVAGHRTTAGCPSYGVVPAESAPVVEALEAAGAVVVGITNLDQFATGLVGTRSPHGACPNAHWPDLVSGGSSSGSAVAVARGLVDLALGTDTAGSGRVPAAANGIVGVKPTPGRLSTRGVVPACRSLDCVSTFARSVDAAVLAADLAAGYDPRDPWSAVPCTRPPLEGPVRVGVPSPAALDYDGDPSGPPRFAEAVANLLESIAAEPSAIDLDPFLAAGRLLYGGAFVAERYAAVGSFLDTDRADVDPVVRDIIQGAANVPAWQLARDRDSLARLRRATEATWRAADVIAVPTVPRIPRAAEVRADPVGPNAVLGTYTTFANLLGLCALTLPTEPFGADRPPFSVTLIGPPWADALLAGVARRLSSSIGTGRPATLRAP
jgi:allophanate hydrolase